MTAKAQSVLLMAVGGIAFRLGLSDASLAYIGQGLRPPLAVTGVATLLVAVHGLFRPDTDDGHGHGSGGPKVGWALMAPLLVLLLVAPDPLGAYAASRQPGVGYVPEGTEFAPLPDPVGGAVDLDLQRFASRALFDGERSLAGAPVRLAGFVSDDTAPGGGFVLSRFVVGCCAADAAAVHLRVDAAVSPPVDGWVEVVGVWDPAPRQELPTVVPESVRPVAEPDVPYLPLVFDVA